MNMLVAVDIGNSSIKLGYFFDQHLTVQRIPTFPLLPEDEYRNMIHAFIRQSNIEIRGCSCIISSVVSGYSDIVREALQGLQAANISIVDHEMSGLGFKIKHPEQLGTDRIANALAAFNNCRQPVAVIDFGTATTLSVVDGSGCYIGGAIMPGLALMNRALGSETSRLSEAQLKEPASALGKDTEGCMRSGLIIGTAGAAERIIGDIEAETMTSYFTILTGGSSGLMDRFIRRPHVIKPDLTLEGLRIIHEKNRPQ